MLGHSDPILYTQEAPGSAAFRAMVRGIYVFHMPLFFFISGFLAAYSGRGKAASFRADVRRRAVRLLGPYLVLNLAAGVVKWCFAGEALRPITGVSDLLATLAYPGRAPVGYSWFLVSLFLVQLSTPLATAVREAGTLAGTSLSLLSTAGWLLWNAAPLGDDLLCLQRSAAMLFFFWHGFWLESCWFLRTSRQEWRTWPAVSVGLLLAAGACIPEMNAACYRLTAAIGGIGAVMLTAYACGRWLPKALEWLEPAIYPVYLLSWFALVAARVVASRLLPHAYWPGVVWMCGCGLLGPWLAYRWLRGKTLRCGWIIGLPGQRQPRA